MVEAIVDIDVNYSPEQQPKKTATIILAGITGCGKSTLAQSIKDYIEQNSFREKGEVQRLNITNFRSQTQAIEESPLENNEWDIKVVDTPGYADTDGKKKDIEHFDELAKYLLENASFNAFCFVLKYGECRLTPELLYAYNKLKKLFSGFNENFFVVLTHSEGESHSKDLEGVIKGLGLASKNVFYLNNIAYQKFSKPEDLEEQKDLEDQQTYYYFENFNGIKKLLEASAKMKPFISDGRIYLQLRKFSLLCELAEEILKRDSTFYETAQILDLQQKITQQLIAKSDCKIQKVVMKDYDIGEEASSHVVCLICSKFCRKVMAFEKKKEIDFSNYFVQYYKEKIENQNLGFFTKLYRYAALIPISVVGLFDLVYANKCRHCKCPPVYHAKFGKIDPHEYQKNDEKVKTPKFGKKLIIQEDANIFQGPDFKVKMNMELKDLEDKRNEYQESIQKKYDSLNKLDLIGAPFVYKTTLELEMKKTPTIPNWLKDLVDANNGQQHHLQAFMALKHDFLTNVYNIEDKPLSQQIL